MQKVAVFLDYANVEAASRATGREVDYGALLEYLADENEGRTLKAAYAYVPIDPRLEHAKDRKIDDLWGYGYIVRSKVGTVAGNTYKCDFDIEMTLDIVRASFEMKPDIVVIVSGDSDFVPVVLDLREKGIRVEVAAFDYSMSIALMRKCSGYIRLDALNEPDSGGYDENDEEAGYFDEASNDNNITGNDSNRQEEF